MAGPCDSVESPNLLYEFMTNGQEWIREPPDGQAESGEKLKRKDTRRTGPPPRGAGAPAGMGEAEGPQGMIVFEGRDGAGKGGTIEAIASA